jgi:hypothetical protein
MLSSINPFAPSLLWVRTCQCSYKCLCFMHMVAYACIAATGQMYGECLLVQSFKEPAFKYFFFLLLQVPCKSDAQFLCTRFSVFLTSTKYFLTCDLFDFWEGPWMCRRRSLCYFVTLSASFLNLLSLTSLYV